MGEKEVNKKRQQISWMKIFDRLCRIYVWCSTVIIPLFAGLAVYLLLYSYNKDGEYCHFEKTGWFEIIVDNEKCALQPYMMVDFTYFTAFLFVLWQLPVWIVWGLVTRIHRYRKKKREAC